MEFRKFRLALNQSSPNGSTYKGFGDNWIVWVGTENTFPTNIESQLMTTEEIWSFQSIDYINAIQNYLDNEARTHNYDGILSL